MSSMPQEHASLCPSSSSSTKPLAEDARAEEVKEAERAVEARVEEVTAPRRSPR